MIPVLTTWNIQIFEKCPNCNSTLFIKYADNGMPFITCDNCSYKKELILFKKCPKCGGSMKYIHKLHKLKCEGCNTWYKVKLEEDIANDNQNENTDQEQYEVIYKIVKQELANFMNSSLFYRRVSEIIIEEVSRIFQIHKHFQEQTSEVRDDS